MPSTRRSTPATSVPGTRWRSGWPGSGSDILGFAVGIRENFFGVGGNSLDAARVIDAILVEFGVQLPLNVLTEHPTVERLATLLRDHAERLSGPLVAIQDGDGTRPPLFLVHPDNGQVGPYCRLAYALGEEFAVFGIQAAGLYSDAEPRRTVPAMADCLRRRDPGGTPHRPLSARRLCHRRGDRLRDGRPARRRAAPGRDRRRTAGTTGHRHRVLVAASRPGNRTCRGFWRAGRSATWYRRTWHPSSSRARCACGRPTGTPCATGGHRRTPGRSTSSACRRRTALPATVVQRTHECGADGRLAGAFRELIG